MGVIFMQKTVRRAANLSGIKFAAAFFLVSAILFYPQTAVDSARKAMHLWYASVAPALFPFMALMPLLTGPDACRVYERMFGPIMGVLFDLPGSAAPGMIAAMLAGSPAGAAAIARTAGQSNMTQSQLRRFAPVVCGVGPAYLVMGVGSGLLGSPRLGFRLAAIQFCVQIAMLLILRFINEEESASVQVIPIQQAEHGIRNAVESVLSVCGYMVLFSVSAAILAKIAGKTLGEILLLSLDLPSGMALIAEKTIKGRNLLLGMATGFGGICIMAQNMEHLKPLGLRWKDMLCVKFAQSALIGAISSLILSEKTPPFQVVLPSGKITYAFSLLFSLILSLPILIYLSNKLFLNKRKSRKSFSS